MGIVLTTLDIGNSPDNPRQIRFVFDTGSPYTAIDATLRDELELLPGMPGETELADGRIVSTEITLAFMRINGRQAIVPVEVMDVPIPLLGVTALEGLGMKVDAVRRRLEIDTEFRRPPTLTRFQRFDLEP